jgi:hypothetical protein
MAYSMVQHSGYESVAQMEQHSGCQKAVQVEEDLVSSLRIFRNMRRWHRVWALLAPDLQSLIAVPQQKRKYHIDSHQ